MKKSSPLRILAATVLLSAALCSEPARAQITVGGNGSNTTDSTAYSGAQTLTKIGTNTVTLTGDSNYTGVTTINAGTLLLDKSAGAQLYKTGAYFGIGDAVTVNNGGTLQTWNWSYGANNALSELMTNYTAVVLNGGKVVVDDTFSADRAFTVGAGGATLETTAGNTYTKVANSNEFNLIRFTANSNLTVGGEGNTVINDALGSFGNTGFSITKNGTGTLTLGGSNSYTGGTTVNAGTLSLSAANRLANSGAVTVNGGSFNLGGFSDTVGAVTLADGSITNGTLTGSSYAVRNGTVSAVLAGTGALTKTTAGTVTLTADNTFNGTTTINAGTLVLDKAAGAQLFKTGDYLGLDNAVTVNTGGTLQTWNWGYGLNNALSELMTNYNGVVLNGGKIVMDDTFSSDRGFSVGANGGTIETTAGNTYTKPAAINSGTHIRFTANSTLTVGGDGNTVIGEALSSLGGNNGFSIAKTGAGTLTLGGNNTYTGTTTISGGTLRVGTGSTSGTLGSGAITNNGSLVFDRSNAISVANTMTGIGSLTKNGSGTLTLSGSAAHTGGTTINAGTLSIGANNTLSDSGTVTINSGGTFNMGSFGDYIGTLVMNGNATVAGTSGLGGGQFLITQGLAESPTTKTLTATGSNNTIATNIGISSQWGGVGNNANLHFNVVGASDTLSVSGVIANLAFDGGGNATTGSITKTGAGTLTLNGSNTYTGGTTVNAGTLRLGAANRLADSGAVTVNGGSFHLGGFSETVGAVTVDGGSIANGTLTGSSYAVQSGAVSVVLAGSGALTKTTAGTVTLTADNTFTGATTINAGTLVLDKAAGAQLYKTGSFHGVDDRVVVNTGGTLQTWNWNYGSDNALSQLYDDYKAIVVNGGRVVMDDTFSASRGFTVGANGATLETTAGNTYTKTANTSGSNLIRFTANSTLTVGGAGNTVINDALGSSGNTGFSITKNDAGTLTLGGDNSYTGATTINAGSLVLDKVSGAQLYKTGSFHGVDDRVVVNTGGTLQTWNWNYGSDNALSQLYDDYKAIVVNGGRVVMDDTFSASRGFTVGANGATLETTAGNTYTKTANTSGSNLIRFTANSTLTVGGAGNTVINDALGSSGNTGFSIAKNDAGTLTLGGDNSYTGTTTISAGTLRVGSGGTSGTLGLGAITNNASLVFDRSNAISVANAISGTGSLIKNGSGTLTLTGNNTYSGGTTVSAGRLTGTTSSLQGNIANNAALEFSQSANGTYLGSVSGSGSLTKSGSGTLTLSGNSTYTGATSVSAGQLTVDGAIASTATVQSGASIGGSGRVGGLILESGSTLNPGNSPGIFTVSGNATWNGGANFNWQVYATNADPAVQTGAGTGWDFLDVDGTLTLGLDTTNRFNLNLWSLSGTNPDANGMIPGWDPNIGSTWLLASAANGITLNGGALTINTDYSGFFNINTAATNGTGGWVGALTNGGFQIITLGDANNLYLRALVTTDPAVIPEPGQVAASILLLVGIGIHLLIKRRKEAKAKAATAIV